MSKLKVSFDCDGTLLHRVAVQDYCRKLLADKDVEVHITTRRYGPDFHGNTEDSWWCNHGSKNWEEVFEFTDSLGIPRDRIVFLNMTPKADFFIDKNFLWHLDDERLEIDEINENCSTRCVDVKCTMWETTCSTLIDNRRDIGNYK